MIRGLMADGALSAEEKPPALTFGPLLRAHSDELVRGSALLLLSNAAAAAVPQLLRGTTDALSAHA